MKNRINIDFCLLTAFVIAVNGFFLRGDFFPSFDTQVVFTHFYFFYNHFFFHHRLAEWMPSCLYGIPTLFPQIHSLTPMSYLCGLIGALFRVGDVLLLWKISVVLEQMVFLSGLYWLTRLLFRHRGTVIFVCLSGVLSILWWGQIIFNLRLFYLVPLILYFLLRFFKEERPAFLWLSGIAGIIALFGIMPYVVGLWLFAFSCFMLVLSFRHGKAFKKIFARRGSNLILFLVLIMLAAGYVYVVWGGSLGVHIVKAGRDPVTGVCPLDTFLTYGGLSTPQELFAALVFPDDKVHPLGEQNMIYAGLLTLVFFAWSVVKARGVVFYAFLLTTAALLGLSFGGGFARVVYYFPLMAYFRHLGHILGLVRLFVIICAGFGFENFIRNLSHRQPGRLAIFVLVVFLALAAVKATVFSLWAFCLIGYFLLAWGGWWFFSRAKGHLRGGILAGWLFAGLLILDMGFYQKFIYDQMVLIPPERRASLDSVYVHRGGYQPQRVFAFAPGSREDKAMDLLYGSGKTFWYSWGYGFIQKDLCLMDSNAQLKVSYLDNLATINPVLPAVLGGCFEPKLRLYADVAYLGEAEEKKLFQRIDQLMNAVAGSDAGKALAAVKAANILIKDKMFLRADDDTIQPEMSLARLPSEAVGSVALEAFNGDELVAAVDVKRPEGGWLFYADNDHPDWHVRVDDKEEPLFLANGLFKAVFLKSGRHNVRFFFDQGWLTKARVFMALAGLLAGVVFFLGIILTFARPERGSSSNINIID